MIRLALLTASASVAALSAGIAGADPELGAATLPGARAGTIGDTLTVFAAMVNGGDTGATACAPSVSGFPGSFSYRAVEPDNQTFSAPSDTPVALAPGEAQNFILAFTPTVPLEEEEIDLAFDCADALPAPRVDGVNGVLLTAESAPGPDILPIIVTPSGDNVIRIAAPGRARAASIAAVNIGAGTNVDVIVTADMGGLLEHPLRLGLCETGDDGRCVDESGDPAQTPPPPGQTQINATIGQTASTFSIFAYADTGAGVRFNPDLSRVHVRFFERTAPPVAPEELASISLARDPANAAVELSGVSGAVIAPGQPPLPGENLPQGIFQAVFETEAARGEGLLVAGPDGALAGGFDLEQQAAPFEEAELAFFGSMTLPEATRVRVENGRLHDTGAGEFEPYTLRGRWERDHYVEGSLEPVADTGSPRILFRGQYLGLTSRDVPVADLSGPYQVLVAGRPLGSVNFSNGGFEGQMNDGAGGSAPNCVIGGDFVRAGQDMLNLFEVSADISTVTGEQSCRLRGSLIGLGFESGWPGGERGSVTDNVLTAFVEAGDNQVGAALQFRPVLDTGFVVMRVASGLDQALFVTGLPGATGRILVVRQTGEVHIVDPDGGGIDPDLFLDVGGTISTGGERGLLGLALDPDFETNGTVYVNVTNLDGDTEIRRYSVFESDPDRVDPSTADVILTYAQPAANHNGGWLGFGPDGYLYIASGDGGGTGDPGGNAQDTNNLLGAILRIDPGTDQFPADPTRDYAIPAGNPFADGGGAPELWAWGLRNPYRASFDPVTGDLLIGDVGQGLIEEIDRIPARQGGLNFGWNLREGTQSYEGGADSDAFTLPVAEYRHGSGPQQGNSVTGGYVFRGEIEALDGHYVFGDFVSGNIWSIPVEYLVPGETVPAAAFIRRNADFTPDTGEIGNVSSFGTDTYGHVYIVDYDGEVFRIDEPF